jgi:hypothetical protein
MKTDGEVIEFYAPARLRVNASDAAEQTELQRGAAPSCLVDQRRPGRLERVAPALTPMLRAPTQCGDIDPDKDTDTLAPGRAMVVGVLLSGSIWAVIGFGVWLVL